MTTDWTFWLLIAPFGAMMWAVAAFLIVGVFYAIFD